MTSRSTPLIELIPPVVCGRSPAFETATPLVEWLELKKLFAGLFASESVVPFQAIESPLPRFEPAYPIAATFAS
jgi:hypothetical protein